MLKPETIDGGAPYAHDPVKATDRTEALLEERSKKWGAPEVNWARTAQVWSGILNHEVTALQAALCMAGMKLVRAETCPEESDSFDDAHGYVAIGERIAGPGPGRCGECRLGLGIHDSSDPLCSLNGGA